MSANHDYALSYPTVEGRHWPVSLVGAVVLGFVAVLILESSPGWLAVLGVIAVLALALHDRGTVARHGGDVVSSAFGRNGSTWDGGSCHDGSAPHLSRRKLRGHGVVDGGSFERAR